jgi:hypothetical protein
MLLWRGDQAVNKLGGGGQKEISQKANPRDEAWREGSFQEMSPERFNGCPNVHPNPFHRDRPDNVATFFGGAPCPSKRGAILETICNLINAILHSDDWNPLEFLHRMANGQHLIPKKSILPDDTSSLTSQLTSAAQSTST